MRLLVICDDFIGCSVNPLALTEDYVDLPPVRQSELYMSCDLDIASPVPAEALMCQVAASLDGATITEYVQFQVDPGMHIERYLHSL